LKKPWTKVPELKAVSAPDPGWPVETGYGLRCFLLLAAVELMLAGLGRLILQRNQIGSLLLTLLARMLDVVLISFFLKNKGLSFADLGLSLTKFRRGFIHALIWSSALIIGWFMIYGTKLSMLTMLVNLGYSTESIVYLLVGVLFGPAVEELVFRGWLYGSFRNRLNAAASIAISSVLFSLAHGSEGSGIVLTFLGGVLFSLSYETSRSLLTPIILHIGGNAFLRWCASIIIS
jgi:hypothetical protein